MFGREKYGLVASEDEEVASMSERRSEHYRDFHGTIRSWTRYLLVAIVSAALGFAMAKYHPLDGSRPSFLVPFGMTVQALHYNETFTTSPTEETEKSWRSIFPRGRGFIHHPELAPVLAGFTVFHQLHCLSGIRLGYYAALNGNVSLHLDASDADAKTDALNAHVSAHHVRHCFDFLRQTIMCAADTNLEQVNRVGKNGTVRGSTGWGFERQCRDYDALVKWAEEWRPRPEQFQATDSAQ